MTDPAALIREAILSANRELEAAVHRGDLNAITSKYSPTTLLLPPSAPHPIDGIAGVADFWEAALLMGLKDFKIESLEIDPQGETAIDVGRYTSRGEGGKLIDQGNYIAVWKRVQGTWKIHRDIWNSSSSRRL
jgi:ketosteroid isomerase-like protein